MGQRVELVAKGSHQVLLRFSMVRAHVGEVKILPGKYLDTDLCRKLVPIIGLITVPEWSNEMLARY